MTPPRASFSSLLGCAPDVADIADAASPDLAALLAGLPGAACVDDTAFAAAYEATGDVDRARLKTCIARLHVLYGQSGDVREGHAVTRWRQGFVSMERATPCAWALVCMDGAWTSAPRLLAALLPALFAGVGCVAVLRTGDKLWPTWTPLRCPGCWMRWRPGTRREGVRAACCCWGNTPKNFPPMPAPLAWRCGAMAPHRPSVSFPATKISILSISRT